VGDGKSQEEATAVRAEFPSHPASCRRARRLSHVPAARVQLSSVGGAGGGGLSSLLGFLPSYPGTWSARGDTDDGPLGPDTAFLLVKFPAKNTYGEGRPLPWGLAFSGKRPETSPSCCVYVQGAFQLPTPWPAMASVNRNC
jgi:hypothetical protein